MLQCKGWLLRLRYCRCAMHVGDKKTCPVIGNGTCPGIVWAILTVIGNERARQVVNDGKLPHQIMQARNLAGDVSMVAIVLYEGGCLLS